jgi:hypothetical protein
MAHYTERPNKKEAPAKSKERKYDGSPMMDVMPE